MNRRHLVAASAALTALGAHRTVTAQSATPAASPETCPITSPDDNTALARRWYDDVLTGHDLATLDDLVASPSTHASPSFATIEDSHVVLEALLTAFPDVVATVEQTVAEDDLVTVRWSFTGTHNGEYLGHAPTGRSVTVTGINIFRFACGRIAEVWSEVNLANVFRQLGLPLDAPAAGMATPTS